MSLTGDILASYTGPGRVVRQLLAAGPREDRALAFLMGGCLAMFLGRLPGLVREAHLSEEALNPMLGGAMLAWLFIMPLVLYGLAFVTQQLSRLAGGRADGYGARLALFWALVAATPLALLYGLVAGFLGDSLEKQMIGALWFAVFIWFWGAGFWVTQWPAGQGASDG